jgi:predicted small integral membrane protein
MRRTRHEGRLHEASQGPGNHDGLFDALPCEIMIIRIAKIMLPLALAAFAFIVTFDNLVDYRSNFLFVQHVLSMDTTFPGNALIGRAITSPVIWQTGYCLIIAAEGATCLLLLGGSLALWQARRQNGEGFNAAKRLVTAGCLLGFLVWFFGFMVVGGEWFAMWQSKTWNGQEAAFRFYMTIVGVLIFVNQPDGDLT